MILAAAAYSLALAQPSDEIFIREPTTPSRTSTRFEARCGGRIISIGWSESYPGQHEIDFIVVDGVPLAEEVRPRLFILVGEKQIEDIRVSSCGVEDGVYTARLWIIFGEASARHANSARIVELIARRGTLTLVGRRNGAQ